MIFCKFYLFGLTRNNLCCIFKYKFIDIPSAWKILKQRFYLFNFLRKIMTICTIYAYLSTYFYFFAIAIAMLLGQVKKDKLKTLKVLMYLLSFSDSLLLQLQQLRHCMTSNFSKLI
jgi:hypothetical protein